MSTTFFVIREEDQVTHECFNKTKILRELRKKVFFFFFGAVIFYLALISTAKLRHTIKTDSQDEKTSDNHPTTSDEIIVSD